MKIYEEYEDQREKRRAQRGAERGKATGKARGYVLVFNEDGHNRGLYDGIGELYSGAEPGDGPRAMVHVTPHIDYLRDHCRFVGFDSIPHEWKRAFARYLDNALAQAKPAERKRYKHILKHAKAA